ncbi:hypothetical protein ACFSX9_12030 [Flavobacterium ardleyense]|uniref:Uncharacterized protein n=1 Tax=Flavobacterium ardleyense TaxID=2038737 RepID=A0ABW5ZB64_9FLAO
MDFAKNYKNLTDDKIISLLKDANALKPEALVALKNEVLSRKSLFNDLADKIASEQAEKVENIVLKKKSYFIKLRFKALAFCVFNLLLFLVIRYFILKLFFIQIVLLSFLLTSFFLVLFRKSNPVVTVKSDSIAISKYKKIPVLSSFMEFKIVERFFNIILIAIRSSKIHEIKYEDIIEIDVRSNEIYYYSDEMSMEQILKSLETIFEEKNFSTQQQPRRILKATLMLGFIKNKPELLKVLRVKKVKIIV